MNGCWEGPDNTGLHTLVRLTLCNGCYLIIGNSREEIRSAYVMEEKLAQRRQPAVCSTPTGQGAAVVARAVLVLQRNALQLVKVCYIPCESNGRESRGAQGNKSLTKPKMYCKKYSMYIHIK